MKNEFLHVPAPNGLLNADAGIGPLNLVIVTVEPSGFLCSVIDPLPWGGATAGEVGWGATGAGGAASAGGAGAACSAAGLGAGAGGAGSGAAAAAGSVETSAGSPDKNEGHPKRNTKTGYHCIWNRIL